jgi:hypothetical protein
VREARYIVRGSDASHDFYGLAADPLHLSGFPSRVTTNPPQVSQTIAPRSGFRRGCARLNWEVATSIETPNFVATEPTAS